MLHLKDHRIMERLVDEAGFVHVLESLSQLARAAECASGDKMADDLEALSEQAIELDEDTSPDPHAEDEDEEEDETA